MIAVMINLNGETKSEVQDLLKGYVIEVNEDNTLIIDLGKNEKIKIDDEFIVYSHDKIVKHPITGEEIRVSGMEIANAIVKDIYDNFSILSVDPVSIKQKVAFEPGFSVKYVNTTNDNLKTRLKKRMRKESLKSAQTTVYSSFSSGLIGNNTPVIYENFLVGYKFPTRLDYFRFELQISQFLSLLNVYTMQKEIVPQIHVYANTVFHFEIWQHKADNGGIGLIAGCGFTQTGVAGNAGIIIGNMNKTGLAVNIYGLWNSSLIVDMLLNIQLVDNNKFGMGITSEMMYTYSFEKNPEFVHGINFTFGPSFKIKEHVYINAFGGVTNTASDDFGGIGGVGLKLVF